MKAIAFFLGLGVLVLNSAWAADNRDLALYIRDQGDKPIDPKTVKANANVLSGKDRAPSSPSR